MLTPTTPRMKPRDVTGRGTLSASWLVVLAFLATAAPLATDLYLPGFPQIQSEFTASASGVQLTLTGFFVGMAVGQLAFGSLSDRYGRIKPLVLGTVGALGSSLLAATAPSLEVLTTARILQGLFGAAGVVIARAIVVDLTEGAHTAKTMSLMMSLTGIAPVVAPSLGAMTIGPFGWRGTMGLLAGMFGLMLAGVLLVIRETLPPPARGQRSIAGGFAELFRTPRYLGYAGLSTAAFATMMTYIAASSFVYQNVIGLSAEAYGALFGINAVGLIAAGYASSKLAVRFGPKRLLAIAGPALLLSSIVLLALSIAPLPRWLIAIPILPVVTSVGFILGNASALALGEVRHVSGSGSAFLGAAQFLLGALVAPLAGLGGEHTAIPMSIIMTVTAACATALIVSLRRSRPS